MQQHEVQQIKHGLYKIHWKSGGSSLASVGSFASGQRWFAPTNWINSITEQNAIESWKSIERMELIVEGVDITITREVIIRCPV